MWRIRENVSDREKEVVVFMRSRGIYTTKRWLTSGKKGKMEEEEEAALAKRCFGSRVF